MSRLGHIHDCEGLGTDYRTFRLSDCDGPLQQKLLGINRIEGDGPCPGPAGAIRVAFTLDSGGVVDLVTESVPLNVADRSR